MWAEFEPLSKRWMDLTYVQDASRIPPILYHYTDAAGLEGMLRSGRVWATDYRFLNDKLEIEYTRSSVRKLISSKLSKTTNVIKVALYSALLKNNIIPLDDAFIFSMSDDGDDLSQWRGYAKEGNGFCIGFCGPSIYKSGEPDNAQFGFVKVLYNVNHQQQPITRALADLERAVMRLVRQDAASARNIYDTATILFAWFVNNRAAVNKHKSFRREREWRTVTMLPKSGHADLKVRVSGVRLVRYTEVPLDLDQEGRLPIKEIGVGPGFLGNDEAFASVEALCRQTGYKVRVYSADSPYRHI